MNNIGAQSTERYYLASRYALLKLVPAQPAKMSSPMKPSIHEKQTSFSFRSTGEQEAWLTQSIMTSRTLLIVALITIGVLYATGWAYDKSYLEAFSLPPGPYACRGASCILRGTNASLDALASVIEQALALWDMLALLTIGFLAVVAIAILRAWILRFQIPGRNLKLPFPSWYVAFKSSFIAVIATCLAFYFVPKVGHFLGDRDANAIKHHIFEQDIHQKTAQNFARIEQGSHTIGEGYVVASTIDRIAILENDVVKSYGLAGNTLTVFPQKLRSISDAAQATHKDK
jgi:hypothetical protein